MNTFKKKILAQVLVGGVAVSGFSAMVQAQGFELEEVIVTATKRAENLQDVPVAVTALSADMLANNRITQSEDLTNLTPALTFQSGGGGGNGDSFNIRGIGTRSFSSGVEPSVSTVIDGVVMGRAGMGVTELVDIERVEVLRGPQGMLYGKNASAGVVHIITKDPGDELEASFGAKTNVSGTDATRYTGMVSVPITDNFAVRATYFDTERDNHVKNLFDNQDYNGRQAHGGRIKFLWEPTDDLSVKWISDFSDIKSDCCQFQSRVATPTQAALMGDGVTASDTNTTVNVSSDNIYGFSESKGHSLALDWSLGEYEFTSITALREFKSGGNVDVDGTPVTMLDINDGSSEQKQISQEFRLASPMDQAVTWVAGLYMFEQEMDRGFERVYHDVFGTVIPGLSTGWKFGSTYQANVDTSSKAAFGQLVWNLNEELRLIAGARHTKEDLEFRFEREASEGVITGIEPNQAPYSDSTGDDDLSLKLSLQWDILDDSMFYATWTEGYKGPAYNVIFESTSENTDRVNPETGETFEAGLKARLFDNRLSLNTAIFYSTFENFQAQAQDASSSSFTLLNAGEVRTQGVEVDFAAQLTENFHISGGMAYIDAQVVDFKGAPCSARQTQVDENGCASGSQDISGKQLPHSPDVKYNLSAEYVAALGEDYSLVPRATYRWQDDVNFGLDQDAEKIQEAYGILDASLTLEKTDGSLQVTLFVNNALDKQYADLIVHNNIWAGAYDHIISPNSQRTVGLELNYNWQ